MDEVNLVLVIEPNVSRSSSGGPSDPRLVVTALRATILIKLQGRVCADGRGEPSFSH